MEKKGEHVLRNQHYTISYLFSTLKSKSFDFYYLGAKRGVVPYGGAAPSPIRSGISKVLNKYPISDKTFFPSVVLGITALKKALRSIISQSTLTVQAMVYMAIFMITLGVISSIFGTKVIDLLFSLSAAIIPSAAMSIDQGAMAISSSTTQALIIQVVLAALMMAASALISFCIFGGLAWRTAYRLAGTPGTTGTPGMEGETLSSIETIPPIATLRSMATLPFLGRFTRLCLLLFPFYLLYELLAFARDFRELSAERMPGLEIWNPSILVPILAVLVSYMVFLSFSLVGTSTAKKSLSRALHIGFSRISTTLPSLLPLILLLIIVEALSRALLMLGNVGSYAGIILVLLWWVITATSLIGLFEGSLYG